MKGRTIKSFSMGVALVTGAALGVTTGPQVHAGPVDAVFGEPNFSFGVSGFLRHETAIKAGSNRNPANQTGNFMNGVPVFREGSLLDGNGEPLIPTTSGGTFTIPGVGIELPVPDTGVNLRPTDTVRRVPESKDNIFNLEYLRGELAFEVGLFSNLRFEMNVRGIADPDIYDNFDPEATRTADNIGILQQNPNLFEYRYDSGPATSPGRGEGSFASAGDPNPAREAQERAKLQALEGSSPLEWAGEEYMVDLPKAYLEYDNGGFLMRLGNQQIAWGDLLFFRIMDVPNGLDLRRHSVLDLVVEEFSDKRIPSLGARAAYLVGDNTLPFNFLGGWELDTYVQRFRPTIYPNPNTPYNAIPSQFTVHDQFKEVDDELNYGLRLRGDIGPLDVTLMANRRYGHFGVFSWTDSDVVQGLQPNGPNGCGSSPDANATCTLLASLTGGFFANELADTVFEVDPTGVTSAREFYTYGAFARLDHFTGLNRAITAFPASGRALAQPASSPANQELQENIFLQLSGGLRGHIQRTYHRENNFGLGLSYRFEGPQDSMLFDQVNLSVEAKYTPDRTFTPIDLQPVEDNLFQEDEFEIGVVAQKFVRYSATFPAAFAVLQYYHRSESDLFQRHLSGYGQDPFGTPEERSTPPGISSANYVAFAFQQPFPNRIWRIDFAALYDVKGGLLVQPALRWKINRAWTIQTFYNWVDTVHGLPSENVISTVDYADEFTTRIAYQF